MKSVIKYLFLVAMSFSLCTTANSQTTLLNESFEGGFPPSGWTLTNINGNAWMQGTSVGNGLNGGKYMYCQATGSFSGNNAWAFTPPLSLSANISYRISYWYRKGTFGGGDTKFKVTIGSSNTISAQTTVIHDYPTFPNTAYQQGIDTILISASGIYYLGFNNYTPTNQSTSYLDSIVVLEIAATSCATMPSQVIVSGPLIVLPDSSFTLILSNDYTPYPGVQFQWQSSIHGINNFQDIPGATMQSINISQNINKDYRCTVTCSTNGFSTTTNIMPVYLSGTGGLFRQKFAGNVNNDINGIYFLNPSQGFAAFSDALGYTQDSGQTFIKRFITAGNTDFNGYSVNLTFGFSLSGVFAFSSDSLLIYGDYGAGPAILFSANQGLNWKVVFHQPYSLVPDIANSFFDMKFINSSTGIAINQKYIVETSDRGQNWVIKLQVSPARASKFSKLSAPSSTIAYAAAGDYIYKRTNNVWAEMVNTLPANSGLNFNNISFTNNNTGYISKDDNYGIYKTLNGGTTWTRMNDTLISPVPATDICFVNDSTGFAGTMNSYTVLKTSNSGISWETCKRNSTFEYLAYGMKRLFFLNDQTGWASGRGEFLMLTTSGGNPTIPKAIFRIDTTNFSILGKVNLISLSKIYYQHKWYVNGVLISTGFSPSYIHNVSFSIDTIKLIVSNGIDTDSLEQYQYFSYTLPPTLNSFQPTTCPPNTVVTISGIALNGATAVKFGGIPARSYTVVTPNQIRAVVSGGSSGNIEVTTPNGTATASGFTLILPSAPFITSFSPESGAIGTTVTITGGNFNTVVTDNIVYFGKVKARILSATATQITCEVPKGSSFDPIVVLNTPNRRSAYSKKPFAVTFPVTGSLTANAFTKTLLIPTDSITVTDIFPRFVTAADIDGDGKNDVIGTVRYYNVADSIFIYRNTTSGNEFSFAKRKSIGVTTNPSVGLGIMETIGDIDGDGKLDIAFIDPSNYIQILRNTSNPGSISFAQPIILSTANSPRRLNIRDLDGDGRAEIIMSGATNSKMAILKNISFDTVIAFAPLVEFDAVNPISLASGDIDGDGKVDVITLGSPNGVEPTVVSVFRNTTSNQNITFAPKIDLATLKGDPSTVILSLADLNNDGKLDIIFNNGGGGTTIPFSVFKNTSSINAISFSTRQDFSAVNYEFPLTGELSNLDGDIQPDYVTADYNSTQLRFYKNISNTDINLQPGYAYGTQGDNWFPCASDLDGDGKQDFIVSSAFAPSRGFYFFKNFINESIPQTSCAGANISINSNLNGASYQWQLDSGTGYTNLSNNATYSGVNTSILSIANAPSSWYGYKYKCITNTQVDVFTLKFKNTWTGAVNNAWENPGNWSCGILPDSNTDVYINSGTAVINSNTTIRSLKIQAGVNISLASGITLTILH